MASITPASPTLTTTTTVAVPDAADPASITLEVVHAVGVEGAPATFSDTQWFPTSVFRLFRDEQRALGEVMLEDGSCSS
jgi:hypothetical protein